MILNTLVFHTVLIPLFASRVCATMFWVAMWAFFQQQGYFDFFFAWSGLEVNLFLEYPTWLVKWPTLVVLGILTFAEYKLENSLAWTQTIGSQDGPIKSIAHLFFSQWVFVKLSITSTAVLALQAGFDTSLLWVVPAALLTWVLAQFRRSGYRLLTEMDEEDDLGIRKLLTQAEDAGIAITAFFLIFLPILALLIGLATIVFLALVRMYVSYREQQIKVPCPHCNHDNHPAAPHCSSCSHTLEDVSGISLFNQPTDKPITDQVQHKLRLLVRRRCPHCATQLKKPKVHQACPSCGQKTFESLEHAKQLDEYLYWLFPKTLLVVSILGFFPLIGLIPGMIYYRLTLIAGYRGYLSRTQGCMMRYVARIITIVLVALQSIPILGAFSLPLLCFLHTAIYRAAYHKELNRVFLDPSEAPTMNL